MSNGGGVVDMGSFKGGGLGSVRCRFVSRRGESIRRGWGGREGKTDLGNERGRIVIGRQCHENGDFKLGWRTQRVDHFVCPGASSISTLVVESSVRMSQLKVVLQELLPSPSASCVAATHWQRLVDWPPGHT